MEKFLGFSMYIKKECLKKSKYFVLKHCDVGLETKMVDPCL